MERVEIITYPANNKGNKWKTNIKYQIFWKNNTNNIKNISTSLIKIIGLLNFILKMAIQYY